jgi:hypothetical protein
MLREVKETKTERERQRDGERDTEREIERGAGEGGLSTDHGEVWWDHLRLAGQVEPYLEQSQRIGGLVVDERKHLSMDHTFASCHPLEVTFSIAAAISKRVSMVDQALWTMGIREGRRERQREGEVTHCRCDSFESPVRVLREARDAIAMVHPIRLIRIKVSSIPLPWSKHILVACGLVRTPWGKREGKEMRPAG